MSFIEKMFVVLAVVFLTVFIVVMFDGDVFGEQGPSDQTSCRSSLWRNAQILQPWYKNAASPTARSKRAEQLKTLVYAICEASSATSVDPELALAIAFRESSLRPDVGTGRIDGKRGERGYFQVMPGSSAENFRPGKCSQHDPWCNAMSALRYMEHLKSVCVTSDPWIWVAAYGRGKCSSRREVEDMPEVGLARRYFCSIDETCDDTWPR